MSVTGYPGGPPVKAGRAGRRHRLRAVRDLRASLGAVHRREEERRRASTSTRRCSSRRWPSRSGTSADYWGTGKLPEPLGTANKMSAPYQAHGAADGYFVMGANNQKLWKQLCDADGAPRTAADPRFSTIALRLANRPALSRRAGEDLPPATAEGLLGRHAARDRHPGGADPVLPRSASTASTRRRAACAWRSTTPSKARCPTSASR